MIIIKITKASVPWIPSWSPNLFPSIKVIAPLLKTTQCLPNSLCSILNLLACPPDLRRPGCPLTQPASKPSSPSLAVLQPDHPPSRSTGTKLLPAAGPLHMLSPAPGLLLFSWPTPHLLGLASMSTLCLTCSLSQLKLVTEGPMQVPASEWMTAFLV